MSRSIIDDFDEIIRASAGQPATEDLRARVFAALEPSAILDESHVPTYFAAGFRQLAARQPVEWTDVDDGEIGLSWILRDLVPLIPGASFREGPGRYEVAVPALRLVFAVATSRTKDRWAVLAEPAAGTVAAVAAVAAASATVRSLGTLNPTAQELEQWARDATLRLNLADEPAALAHAHHLAVLARLAADPATVKRPTILAALDDSITLGLWREGAAGLRHLELVLAEMPAAGANALGETRAWRESLEELRDYALGSGSVSLERARALARQLLRGLRRPVVELAEATEGSWWQFASTFGGAEPREYLYVHPDTGALRFSPVPRTAAQLAEQGELRHRLVPPARPVDVT